MSDTSCDSIAKLRRKLQRVSNKKIIFLDETHIKINEVPRRTLLAPGEKPYVIVTDSSSYAARYDMIGARDVNDRFFFDPARQPDPSMIEPGPLHGLSDFFFDPRVVSRVEHLLTRHGLPAG